MREEKIKRRIQRNIFFYVQRKRERARAKEKE